MADERDADIHALCDDCWDGIVPEHRSPRLGKGAKERCCACGKEHASGIYMRRAKESFACKGAHGPNAPPFVMDPPPARVVVSTSQGEPVPGSAGPPAPEPPMMTFDGVGQPPPAPAPATPAAPAASSSPASPPARQCVVCGKEAPVGAGMVTQIGLLHPECLTPSFLERWPPNVRGELERIRTALLRDKPLGPGEQKCPKCAGCGRIASDNIGMPWSSWEAQHLDQSGPVLRGVVKPIGCPICGGSGRTVVATSRAT